MKIREKCIKSNIREEKRRDQESWGPLEYTLFKYPRESIILYVTKTFTQVL